MVSGRTLINMRQAGKYLVLYSCFLLSHFYLAAQETPGSERAKLLIYGRVISNAKGAVRTDENIVGNFRVTSWLRAEAGLRYGENPGHFNAYYHYKLELQSRFFLKTFRVVARVSDNVITYPAPGYRKTNNLFAVESRFPLGHSFVGMAAAGYVFSVRDQVADALPVTKGIPDRYPVFRIAARYLFRKKDHNQAGFLEAVYGSYDVFNPYEINRPFMQLTGEYSLSARTALFSYFRYQYDQDIRVPFNYFSSAGILFRW